MKRYVPTIVLLGIVLASSLMTMHSSTRVTPLIDYSYQVENAIKIYQGDMPYRDFFLVLPPGVYVVMALLMHLTNGYSHQIQLIATVFVSAVTVLLTYHLGKAYKLWVWTILLSLVILIITGQSTYPWPSYDIWATFSILVSIAVLLLVIQKKKKLFLWYTFAGSLLCIPSLMKQNIGLLYLAGMILILTILLFFQKNKQYFLQYLAILLGIGLSIGGFFGYLYLHNALQPFIYQLFTYSKIMRNPIESVLIIRDQYLSSLNLFIAYLGIVITSLSLLIIPSGLLFKWKSRIPSKFQKITPTIVTIGSLILVTFGCLFLLTTIHQEILMKWSIQISSILIHLISFCSVMWAYKQKTIREQFILLLPIPIIFAIHGAYLSHHVVSSSYGIIPLLIILLFAVLHMIRHLFSRTFLFAILLPMIFTLFYLYSFSLNQQLLFPFVQSYGQKQTASYPRIQGLSTPGPWIPRMENMFRFVQETIPMTDSVAFLPHEDPFFAVTGRKNPLPFVQYGDAVYPRSPLIFDDLIKTNITWLVFKREFQGKGLTFTISPVLFDKYQTLYQLDGYIILKRK